MPDVDVMMAALDAEEAYAARVKMFHIYNGANIAPAVRIVEQNNDGMSYWDLGDEKQAKDFIRMQGWKAAVEAVLRHAVGEQA